MNGKPDEGNSSLSGATIGYGTMHLTGPGTWGPPADWHGAREILRRAYEWGVRLFDTAWYYGPYITHRLLTDAFPRFPADLIIVTKVGNSRGRNKSWVPALTPDKLRAAAEADRRVLGLEVLPLVLLRWHPREGDSVDFIRALAELMQLRESGKIRDIGLSNITLDQLRAAMELTHITAVSNAYSIYNRRDDAILDLCTTMAIPFLPYYPLLGGEVVRKLAVQRVARELGASPAQVALAWLKAQSPMVVPIPGTGNLRHLRDNIRAHDLVIPNELMKNLDQPPRSGISW